MKKIPPVKYMRDFYPELMRQRLEIESAWRAVSERAGFEPWDAPIVEHLDLFTRKSGEEIVTQLYTLTDRGDRELAIRPEMTPSLARLITQRQSALPRPIKWYCSARMCRYERGQRGRLREFWQWNIDLLGVADVTADAEVMSVALDGLEEFGLGPADVALRLNSRDLLAALLGALGIPEEHHAAVYAVTDKRGKVPDETLTKLYEELGLDKATLEKLLAVMSCSTLEELDRAARGAGLVGFEAEVEKLQRLIGYLEALGKGDYVVFDIGIVRGLAYYTGPVFEIFDRNAELRAICGGGRYDRLMETMGGQPMPAVGFGMGDVVLGELLTEKGLWGTAPANVVAQAVPLADERIADAMRLVASLRAGGMMADYVMKSGGLGKVLKRAGESGVRWVIFVGGDEWDSGQVRVKELATGEERLVGTDGKELLALIAKTAL
ncbi:Histidine--tRNA ligase [Planctomycetes bacterium Pan216]|uniref:Histidine--tRNA ligase n=1 Tax=Kolteria novifilia TaxID=2527975 RepID=A0A518B0P0_9BACT|nr:Histidine--tRNA ligase [Planctomycetes bacterium Pan216]